MSQENVEVVRRAASGRGPALLLAALLCLTLVLGLASRAEAFIYWTNTSSATSSIGRANPNGSRVNQSFIPNVAGLGVAVDDAHVYWTNFNEGTIGRANLNGSSRNSSFITGASFPGPLAVDAAHVYWGQSGPTVARANLDGSGTPEFNFIAGDNGMRGVAVDAGHVYWTNFQDNSSIGRANLDGMSPNNAFIGDAFLPVGVAVDAGHIYWANQGTNAIARANLDGNPASVNQSFIPGADSPEGVAVDGSHVYWVNTPGQSIGRANLNGTGIDQSFITGAGTPSGIAVDGLSFPSCQPASASTGHEEAVGMTLQCTSGGGTRTLSIASQPAHGELSGFSSSTGRLTYTPDADFFGADSFRFRASNQGGSSLAATATIEIGLASNQFEIGKVKRNKRKGTAKLTVNVPGPGELELAKTKKVRVDDESAEDAGKEKLSIKPKGKAKKKLNAKGKAKVKANVTFTPTGGPPNTEDKKIKLVKR